ncbi:hypothetical protein PAECIP111893_02969 [Paenibacillus plantiphilus]|uniref:Lipoprotein n=1 Tax=Paenibacillus plantiphilus TaxID=2905650 RepID=A0ABN8GGY8_9BACL|nr:hypothetical protein [Paenibacillus plantiphilus]CAH1209056.1 hypothetical protein PAECIP111893_02969 [Paenibacillus plantiphilus]
MKKWIVVTFVALAAAGCGTSGNEEKDTNQADQLNIIEYKDRSVEPEPASELLREPEEPSNKTIKSAATAKEAITILEEALSLLSPEQADAAIIELEEFYREDLSKVKDLFLRDDHQAALEHMEEPITEADVDGLADPESKQLAVDAIAGKYRLINGEAVVPIVNYRALAAAYSKHLSPAMGAYLDIMAAESDDPAIADASISVPWEELADRAMNIEAYLVEYPKSPRYDYLKLQLGRYLWRFFNGSSNTEIFQSGRMLRPELDAAYSKVAGSHSDTLTGALTIEHRALLERMAEAFKEVKDEKDDPYYREKGKFLESIEARIQSQFDGA